MSCYSDFLIMLKKLNNKQYFKCHKDPSETECHICHIHTSKNAKSKTQIVDHCFNIKFAHFECNLLHNLHFCKMLYI